ncbi:ATP-binding protein [Xanthobacter sp. KR7-65]|uniref:ATP-binding protein n=1 Tax=Xanthobacter sp. KR7-65 TaxID=3156612 RepID=UPI0032B335C5
MTTLRAQVTAILVVAVLVVITLANGASFFLSNPDWHSITAGPAPVVVEAADLAAAVPVGIPAPGLSAERPAGEIDEMATRLLAESLERFGRPLRAVVLRPTGGGPPLTAVHLANGRWLTLNGATRPPPPPGPPGGPFGFAVWLAFMVLGVTGVVFLAVRRLTRPLALVEEAARRIGPDGEPPVLPERGPAEVRAAAAAINRLSARLKAAMDSRMRIVAGAAHDFRTPLTRMRLRAEFIPDDEERTEWLRDLAELDRIADSAIRLVREEVEGGPEEAVRMDLLAAEVVEEVAGIGHAARLVSSMPVGVRGRPLSLKRALRNLVVNAATHGGGARVSVGTEGEAGVLLIEDDGPGIPEALMGQVFEPFFRVDPARQVKIPGAGLGLAIANEIVGRHGGRLTLVNRPGGGLLQRVELPAAPIEA